MEEFPLLLRQLEEPFRTSSHSFPYTLRPWLDVVGTPLGVQKRLMRHTDIRTMMRYGTSAEGDMRHAHEKIVRLALIPA